MHTSESSSSNVPAFLIKLWNLVENPECNDCISWSDTGASFVIRDQSRFSKELLPLYFKHNNMASFIRQLNMYGFRKVMNYNKGGMKCDSDEMEFQHLCFVKGQAEYLDLIKRKMPTGKVNESTPKSCNSKDMLGDLAAIRKKQENMDALLLAMKKENEVLWKELSLLRNKHKAQEQIIQKVIHFLVTLVRSNQGIGPKRKIARMLHDSPSGKSKSSSLTSQLNLVRSKGHSLHISDLTTDQLESPKGPVIHEVTDLDGDDLQAINEDLAIEAGLKDDFELSFDETNVGSSEPEVADSLQSVAVLSPEVLSPSDETTSTSIPVSFDLGNELCVPHEVLNLPSTSTDLGVEALLLSPETIIVENEDAVIPEPVEVSVVSTPYFEAHFDNEVKQNPAESCPDKTTVKTHSDDFASYESLLCCNPKDILISSGTMKEEPENNLQLTLKKNDSSNSDSFALNQNMFSNHVVSVDEDLEWLQNQLSMGTLSIDPATLLGLFNRDDMINNSVLVNHFASEHCGVSTKEHDNDIIGNELVQFTPSREVGSDTCEDPLFPDFVESSSVLNVENLQLNPQTDVMSPPKKKKSDNEDCIGVSYKSLVDNDASEYDAVPVMIPSNRKRKNSRQGKK